VAVRLPEASFAWAANGWADLPKPSLPEVAFIGRSNVGKSSLVNAVLGQKGLARTSGQPGKTRQFNFYRVGERFFIVDLPGFGYARISKSERARWHLLIARYMSERDPLRLVLHLIDARHDPTALDLEVMALVRESMAVYGILLTKSDKLSGNQRERNRRAAADAAAGMGLEVPVILTSAHDGRGIDEVRRWILELAV
jgi:GTP-binding protein